MMPSIVIDDAKTVIDSSSRESLVINTYCMIIRIILVS